MGSYLKTFARSPKNPCLEEYDFALAYFETLINQEEGKLEASEDCLKLAKEKLGILSGIKSDKLQLSELVIKHSQKMMGFLEAKQEMHRGNI